METIEDYAANVDESVRAAVAHAILVLDGAGVEREPSATADWLDVLLEAVETGVDPVEVAMERDGLTTRTDPRDGLRYIVSEVAA